MSKVFEVLKSSIAGSGCFATTFINCGDLIGHYDGDTITGDVAYDRELISSNTSGGKAKNFSRFFHIGGPLFIDGMSNNSGTFFINHGCNPNASPSLISNKVAIHAIRDIPKSTEILIDYFLATPAGTEYSDYRCNCGARTCYGSMSANAIVRSKR